MQHDLDGIVWRVVLVALAPVVADGVGKDGARLIERRRGDAAADVGVPLEPVLGVLVPEVERSVGSCRAERSVDGVEVDVVDSVDVDNAVVGLVAMALEGEIGAGGKLSQPSCSNLFLVLP